MSIPSDIEIARAAKIKPIEEVAEKFGIPKEFLIHYGKYIAKIDLKVLEYLKDRPNAKYIDITAITPTPLGEGKTTTTVGLGMALNYIGKKATIAIRQPSMGPTFGIKGGAAGGGYSQVIPMEDFNLHLTGDIHAIGAAHNLIAAMLDNHLAKGNKLNIDPDTISWSRVVDISDRPLRCARIGIGGGPNCGYERDTHWEITVASELMAILALTTDLFDMRKRIGKIVIAYTYDGKPVTVEDIKAAGAATVLMKDTIKPNLLQTLDNTPALVHAGPFANIAHGNSSILADYIGIKMGDYLVTESGFGADIGMEKFMDIKCRYSGLKPDAVVLVATVRALKYHSGNYKIVPGKPLPKGLLKENPDDVYAGAGNLEKQIENAKLFGVPVVVAINKFDSDYESELEAIRDIAIKAGAEDAVLSTHWAEGAKGAKDLAIAVDKAANKEKNFKFLYDVNLPIKEKIKIIATKVYGADGVKYTKKAAKQIKRFEEKGFGKLPICIAKTHLSLSDDASKVGRPKGFKITVREVKASVGAGFIYPLLGKMRTMPGLPTHPAAERIDINEKGEVVGLF